MTKIFNALDDLDNLLKDCDIDTNTAIYIGPIMTVTHRRVS